MVVFISRNFFPRPRAESSFSRVDVALMRGLAQLRDHVDETPSAMRTAGVHRNGGCRRRVVDDTPRTRTAQSGTRGRAHSPN